MSAVFESVRDRLINPYQNYKVRLAIAFALATVAVIAEVAYSAFAQQAAVSSDGVPAAISQAPAADAPAMQPRSTASLRPAYDAANVAAVVGVVAKRYRISSNAMREVVDAAFVEARRNRLDPLLVIAVMAVESHFNPIAQSEFGATGLMQVIPRYHADKFSATSGESVLDPRTNIRIGARVLREYVSRGGTEAAGLQLYNGSAHDPTRAYAARVLAERARLRDAMKRDRSRSESLPGTIG